MFSRMELYWDTVPSQPNTINLLFKQSGTLKIYMEIIGTMENWNTLSCHQLITNIVNLPENTLQKDERSVISSQNTCVKMWRIWMILVVQKCPNFSTTRILTGILATIRIDTKRHFTVQRIKLMLTEFGLLMFLITYNIRNFESYLGSFCN